MIVKAAKLDKSIKSSFKRLTEYITQEQVQSDINISFNSFFWGRGTTRY